MRACIGYTGSAEGNLISYGTVEFKAKLCWIWKLYVDQSNIDTELSEIREAMPRNQLLRVKRKKEAAERPHLWSRDQQRWEDCCKSRSMGFYIHSKLLIT